MDVMTVATTAAITALVSGIVGAIVASAVGAAKDRARHGSESDKAMRDGMRALLWRELKNLHADATAAGGMSVEDRRHLEGVYGAYHAIGGNGTGTRLYSDAMGLPVIE